MFHNGATYLNRWLTLFAMYKQELFALLSSCAIRDKRSITILHHITYTQKVNIVKRQSSQIFF